MDYDAEAEIAASVAASWANRPLLSEGEYAAITRLTGRDLTARRVDCPSCHAAAGNPCWAPTGLFASEPCAVRLADAARDAAGAEMVA